MREIDVEAIAKMIHKEMDKLGKRPLARAMGVSPESLYNWASEAVYISPHSLDKIAKYFKVDIDRLFTSAEGSKEEVPILDDNEKLVVNTMRRLESVDRGAIREIIRYAQWTLDKALREKADDTEAGQGKRDGFGTGFTKQEGRSVMNKVDEQKLSRMLAAEKKRIGLRVLARKIGISTGTVENTIDRCSVPTMKTLELIAAYYREDVHFFFTGAETGDPVPSLSNRQRELLEVDEKMHQETGRGVLELAKSLHPYLGLDEKL